MPLVVVPLIFIGRRLRIASRLAQDRLGDVAVQAEESVSAIRTVQSFGREDFVSQHFNKAVDDSLQAALSRVRLRGWLSGILIFMVFAGISVILVLPQTVASAAQHCRRNLILALIVAVAESPIGIDCIQASHVEPADFCC